MHTYRQAGRQAGRQTDRQTDRQADRQTDRQTDRHEKYNTILDKVSADIKNLITTLSTIKNIYKRK